MAVILAVQKTGPEGYTAESVDGLVYTVTRDEVLAHYRAETGSAIQRRAKTIAWIIASRESALGGPVQENPLTGIDFDVGTGDFAPLRKRT